MNKFELINKVLISQLASQDKNLLIELIMRSNDAGESWPTVERLCKARGIKHEKNFKGADKYLPGLVTKTKTGRKNFYVLNTPAIEGLLDAEVTIKHTPAVEGVNTPAQEGAYTPAQADNTPSEEGANSTSNNTVDSSLDSSTAPAGAVAQLEETSPKGEATGLNRSQQEVTSLNGPLQDANNMSEELDLSINERPQDRPQGASEDVLSTAGLLEQMMANLEKPREPVKATPVRNHQSEDDWIKEAQTEYKAWAKTG